MTSHPTALVKACLFSISLLIGIGLSEIIVRTTDIHFHEGPFWYFHHVLGWTQKPNASFNFSPSGEEVHVEYNSLGFRDSEHSREKPPGTTITKRVVLVGDSFTEAIEVNIEDTFARRLQRLLNHGGGSRWEVINLAIGDFGSAQQLLALKHYGLSYAPDLVICQVFPLNDICNNSIALFDLCLSPNDPLRPYFVESDGELVLTRAQPGRSFVRRHSAVYRLIEQAWLSQFRPKDWPTMVKIRLPRLRKQGFPPLDPLYYTFVEESEMIEPVAEGWRLTELLLAEMASLTIDQGTPMLAVVVPFENRVSPAWEAFAARHPPPKMSQDYPERRLEPLLRRLGVWPVLMKPVFEQHPDKFFPTRGGHFNPEAHRLTAEAIYATLEEYSFIP